MLIEDGLQRDERRAGAYRDPRRGCPALVEFREPARVHRPAAQHKGLEHDEMNVRERLARAVEQRAVLLLVILDGPVVTVVQLVPEVVHADQDTEHVRMQIDRVGRPSLLQVRHLVAADTAIEEPQPARRARRQHG